MIFALRKRNKKRAKKEKSKYFDIEINISNLGTFNQSFYPIRNIQLNPYIAFRKIPDKKDIWLLKTNLLSNGYYAKTKEVEDGERRNYGSY